MKFEAKLERRTWYVDGKYLGRKAEFVTDETGETAKELTGDFYGDWQGTRHFDGAEILKAHMAREIENREMAAKNRPENENYHKATITHFPCRLGDWGEYRIVTFPA